MGLTQSISKYIWESTLDQFSASAVEVAKSGIIDCTACMLVGSQEPVSTIVTDFVGFDGTSVQISSVIGKGFKSSPFHAALINGTAAHSLDYDDVNWVIKGHPSAVLLPALLALGEKEDIRGEELLLGYMVGFEVMCKISEYMSQGFFDNLGWHPTSVLGAIGAAAGCAKIMGLDQESIGMTLSLAASLSGGLRQNFGSMTKPLHVGMSARNGITAAVLVNNGLTAGSDGLEGGFGFVNAFSGGLSTESNITRDINNEYNALRHGAIEIKEYPSCGSTHLALSAIFSLIENHEIDSRQILGIDVIVDFDPPRSLIHHNPVTGLEAKFSMEYCISAAIIDGKIDLDTFSQEMIMRPDVRDLMGKVKMTRDPAFWGCPSLQEGFHQVQVYLKDDITHSQRSYRVDVPQLSSSTDNLKSKFFDCAKNVLPLPFVEEAFCALVDIRRLDSISTLMDLIRN